jgi:hypothetical protein
MDEVIWILGGLRWLFSQAAILSYPSLWAPTSVLAVGVAPHPLFSNTLRRHSYSQANTAQWKDGDSFCMENVRLGLTQEVPLVLVCQSSSPPRYRYTTRESRSRQRSSLLAASYVASPASPSTF